MKTLYEELIKHELCFVCEHRDSFECSQFQGGWKHHHDECPDKFYDAVAGYKGHNAFEPIAKEEFRDRMLELKEA